MKTLMGRLFGDSGTDALMLENKTLRERQHRQIEYIRKKTNHMLMMMGTLPLRAEELDDDVLLEMDPIGILTEAFDQIREHGKNLSGQVRLGHDEIQAILTSVGVGILVLDSAMRVKLYNHRMVELLGLDEQYLVGKSCCEAVCGSVETPVNCTFSRIMESKRPVHSADWQYKGKHFDVSGAPVKNRVGDITHVILAYTDITGRVESEKRLREREQMYLDVFENVTDLVQCTGVDGSFLYVNRSWRETLGYDAEGYDSLKLWNIIAPERRSEFLGYFNAVMQGERMPSMHTVLFTRDGREVAVEGNMSCSLSNGRPVAALGMFRVCGPIQTTV